MILNERHDLAPAVPTPILANFFRAIGVLVIGVAAFIALALFKSGSPNSDLIDRTPALLLVVGSGGLTALLLFGIGELIHLIAKIEHNTAQEKNQAMLDSLHRIEALLEAGRREK